MTFSAIFQALFATVFLLATRAPAAAAQSATETILFIRHGEKAPDGAGQLSCKGLNRSLALARVMAARYGRIDAVFAPDPATQKPDGALSFDYVRPLATVEPTAIRFGLPVHASIGYDQGDRLLAALQVESLRNAVVLVAWEHHQLDHLVPELLVSLGGSAAAVPKWSGSDFDSIWKVTISRGTRVTEVAFTPESQGLNGLPDVCPN